MKRVRDIVLGTALVTALTAPLLADEPEIYRSTGEHGEMVFSDVAGPGAERVVVETTQTLEDPLAELDRRIEQTLAVADSLEQSRLAREQARADARARMAEARTAAEPEVIYQDRYVASPYLYPRVGYDGRFRDRRHGPGFRPPFRPPEDVPEEPRERTLRKAFPVKD